MTPNPTSPAPGGVLPPFRPYSVLLDKGQKARYGVSYVRALCAHAGLAFTETSPDEDVLAVDGELKFAEASVGLQVKCTSQLQLSGRTASWRTDPGWIRQWERSKLPVYFVLVIVPPDKELWLSHSALGTQMQKTAAYWLRVDNQPFTQSLSIPKSQRLTVETFAEWHNDVLAAFTPLGGGTSA
ncbi:DUF4365 domain-containing protein [Arthrobacter sp. zg-Y750]|uniref:DUF4365 domain-containing protein n=1 Tax=Arthrobacter sp. zg-Y750 TaxID=2894189 RepID=UPI003FA40A35